MDTFINYSGAVKGWVTIRGEHVFIGEGSASSGGSASGGGNQETIAPAEKDISEPAKPIKLLPAELPPLQPIDAVSDKQRDYAHSKRVTHITGAVSDINSKISSYNEGIGMRSGSGADHTIREEGIAYKKGALASLNEELRNTNPDRWINGERLSKIVHLAGSEAVIQHNKQRFGESYGRPRGKSDNMDTFINYSGAVKALGDGKIGALGIVYGGKDLTGEEFTPDTYFGAHKGDGVDCLFHHSLPIKGIPQELTDHIFPAVKVTPDELGLFVEVVLDMADEYEAKVYELAEAGKLGWSSGAAGHTVRKTADGIITRWPIVEFSLTPAPAESRMRFTTLKSLQEEEAEKTIITATTPRELEQSLRDAGFSRSQAKAITSHGFKGLLRDADEPVKTEALDLNPMLDAQLSELLMWKSLIGA